MGLSRHIEVARLLLALAIAGMMLAACGGDEAFEVVEVAGTSTGVQTQDGTMSGPALPTTGWVGSRLRDSVYLYTIEMSDQRASGEQVTTVNCDFAEDDESVVGDCWGTVVITNAGGTWDGHLHGNDVVVAERTRSCTRARRHIHRYG